MQYADQLLVSAHPELVCHYELVGQLRADQLLVSAHPELVEGCRSKLPIVRRAHHDRVRKDFAVVLGRQGTVGQG